MLRIWPLSLPRCSLSVATDDQRSCCEREATSKPTTWSTRTYALLHAPRYSKLRTTAGVSHPPLALLLVLGGVPHRYMLGVFQSMQSMQPVAVLTSTTNSAVFEDTLPGTSYWLRVQSHPASAPAVVWGWRGFGNSTQCHTPPAPPGCRLASVLAARTRPTPTSITVEWAVPQRMLQQWTTTAPAVVTWTTEAPFAGFGDRHEAPGRSSLGGPVDHGAASGALEAELTVGRATLHGLRPGTSYWVTVDGSDPVRFETAPSPANRVASTEVYRVSEGTHHIDLLENHNSGDLVGEAAFLTDSGNFVMPWQQMTVDRCAAAMNQTRCVAGGGQPCMDCLAAAWANSSGVLRRQCSDPGAPWPLDNKVAEAFCGVGFSFFDWAATPVTKYCVRRQLAPGPRSSGPVASRLSALPGTVHYMSCNAPEAAVVHNRPTDPVCICACYADRIIAQQSPGNITAHCGVIDPDNFKYPACNCSKGSVLMPHGSESLKWTGAMQVQCPYFYYLFPSSVYAKHTPCGFWLSHPRGGSCSSPDPRSPGTLGVDCTWRRHPAAQVVYGPQLLGAGWNRSSSFDDATGKRADTTAQTLQNAAALSRAFASAQAPWFRPRCCGC